MKKPTKRAPKKTKAATVLVLRTCAPDMSSHGGFIWPAAGRVKALDWDPRPECGNGLHGFLWGEGNGELASWDPDAKWLVVEVAADSVVDLDGKVKFPRGVVVFCGDRLGATDYIAKHGAAGRAVVGGTATAGTRGTATAGTRGTATAGDGGTATAGDGGTATAGDGGTATAGDSGEIRLRYWDSPAQRYRTVVGYIGEDGLKPNVPYVLADRKFVEKK